MAAVRHEPAEGCPRGRVGAASWTLGPRTQTWRGSGDPPRELVVRAAKTVNVQTLPEDNNVSDATLHKWVHPPEKSNRVAELRPGLFLSALMQP